VEEIKSPTLPPQVLARAARENIEEMRNELKSIFKDEEEVEGPTPS